MGSIFHGGIKFNPFSRRGPGGGNIGDDGVDAYLSINDGFHSQLQVK